MVDHGLMTASSAGPASNFDNLFNGDRRRANFISRILGLFSEEIVDIWCRDSRSPYTNLGRPTMDVPNRTRGLTLDFTLQDDATGKILVAEMKAWFAYESGRYREASLSTLTRAAQYFGPAWDIFLATAKNPSETAARIGGVPTEIDGAVLVWADVADFERQNLIAEYGFADVLSTEAILKDLQQWRNLEWIHRVRDLRAWTNQLFDALAEDPTSNTRVGS